MKGAGGAIAPPLFGRIEGAALLFAILLAPPSFRKPLTPLALVTQQKSTNEHEQHYLYKVAFTYSHPPFLYDQKQYLKETSINYQLSIIIDCLFTLI